VFAKQGARETLVVVVDVLSVKEQTREIREATARRDFMILYKRWNDSSYLFRKLQPITSVK
jgi:hypothetical protein